jgi:MFS family permease
MAKPSEKIQASTWITLAILGSTILITMYGETMLLPAIGDIIRDFNISYSTSSWILTAYLISGAVMTPIAGKLSDIYGKKKMVLIIFIIYIVGISLGGISTNIYILLIARVIQGVGISMFPIAFGIIRDQFPVKKLAIGVGIFSSMFAAGSVVGIAIGGTIIQNFGWQSTFFTIIPVAIVLWIIIRKFVQSDARTENEEKRTDRSNFVQNTDNTLHSIEHHTSESQKVINKYRHNIDLKGAITLAITITSFLLTLTYFANTNNGINTDSVDSHYTFTVFVSLATITIITLILFLIIERKASSPLIPLNLISDKILLPANVILLIFGITMFMVYQTIPILVTSPVPLGFGGDAIDSANIQLPFMIVFLVFAPSSGFIVSKIGNFKPIIIGTILSTIGFFILFVFHATEFMIATNLVMISAGLSLINVGAFNIILQYTPRQFSGISVGISVVIVLIGSSIGPVIASIYMQTYQDFVNGISGRLFPSLFSYNLIFLTATLISIISIVSVIFLKRKIIQMTLKKS